MSESLPEPEIVSDAQADETSYYHYDGAILGKGAAEITFVGEDGNKYYDC